MMFLQITALNALTNTLVLQLVTETSRALSAEASFAGAIVLQLSAERTQLINLVGAESSRALVCESLESADRSSADLQLTTSLSDAVAIFNTVSAAVVNEISARIGADEALGIGDFYVVVFRSIAI